MAAAVAATIALAAAFVPTLVAGNNGPARSPAQPAAVPNTGQPHATASARRPPPIRRLRVGRGATGAVVAFRGSLRGERPAVVFLHGWGVGIPRYDGWVDHLVRLGNTVILPRYQASPQARPDGVRDDAVSGARRALRRLRVQPRSVVFAGHSAGAALAADLAAEAVKGALPVPVAVFAVYPGRAILGYPGGIPAQPLSALPSDIRLTALAGADDRIVAQAPARELVASATTLPRSRRKFLLVKDVRVDDHFAPTRTSRTAQRVFWHRLDRLIRRARSE